MKIKNKQKVYVSVTNDLTTDHRVHKVCSTLVDAGYDVKLIGRQLKKSLPVKRNYKTFRMSLFFKRSALFYAEYNIRLFFLLLFSDADILLSNDTDTLVANYLASFFRRKPLVFDAHELFPEVPELVGRNFVKKVWITIENWIFPKLKNTYTVCQSIADFYKEKYGINMSVVRNIPLASTKILPTSPLKKNGKYILLYQGAVNTGRGIEWMINVMPHLDNCVFYIAGDGDLWKDMQQYSQKKGTTDRVKFLGRVPLENLPSYTVCADIGINLLENKGLNYYYSLPNRIFDYIRAGVPVLSTDFPEIRKMVEKYKIGQLIDQYEPRYLASVIQQMLSEKDSFDGFHLANKELTWENESMTLLKIFKLECRV